MLRYISFFVGLLVCAFLPTDGVAQSVYFQQLDMQDGLSHNHVTDILKDERGFLWFATPAGLNRHDGHEFKVFQHEANDSGSIIDNGINELFIGPKGQLWVKTQMGMNIYDGATQRFIRNVDSVLQTMGLPIGEVTALQCDTLDNCWIVHSDGRLYGYVTGGTAVAVYQEPDRTPISGLTLDNEGYLWTVSERGTVRQINTKTSTVIWSGQQPMEAGFLTANFQLLVDHQQRPWVYVKNQPYGVFWWPDKDSDVIHLTTSSPRMRLSNMNIYDLTLDPKGRVWVATDHGGINILEPTTGAVTYLVHDEFNDRTLSHNSATAVYCDSDGILWVGTFKAGISYYHPNQIQFTLYKNQSGISESILPFDDINQFEEDDRGNIWIGTNGGGLIYFDRESHRFVQYQHQPDDPHSIGSDVIVSLLIDHNNVLWVGTYHGGLNRFDGGRFTRYLHNPSDPTTISDNSVWELFEDSKGQFWVGTLGGGVSLFDRESGVFKRMGVGEGGLTRSAYIQSIAEDNSGALWFGTASGIEVLTAQGEVRYHEYEARESGTLANDYVSDILRDSRGRMWVATSGGLNLYDSAKDRFQVFQKKDGLPDNTVRAVVEDSYGTIWATTTKGLVAIRQNPVDPEQWRCWNYDNRDGLQSAWFNEYAAHRMSNGELLFGGPAGFNIVDPASIRHTPILAKPIMTDFQLFNSSMNTEKWLGKKKIVLDHTQHAIGLVVASLHFVNRDRVRFRYQLEGFDEQWYAMDHQTRKATFTNLDPGNYQFKVMVSADGETWSTPYTMADISILPPFWRTGWAYLLYASICISALLAVRHIERSREKSRFALQREREKANQLAELDRLKTQFFTNISHEFRTPINLILAPLEKLQLGATSESTKHHLTIVQRNARRLLNLVNQLLDFRKIDLHTLKPSQEGGDIAKAVGTHIESFRDLAENKNIDYRYTLNKTQYEAWYDPEKIERILFNLLSNAVKFTPAGGRVTVSVTFDNVMTIVISDTGIGIPEESYERIFERYFQHDTPVEILNKGSGIGLAITKEYVKLLDGTITVSNNIGQGCTFTTVIPLKLVMSHVNGEVNQPVIADEANKRRVLLVEDDEDFRFYLKDNLREHFSVYEAVDAASGWAKTLSVHPDIIVSDVSMPGEDGLALCSRLKADKRTQHVPVILLTAMADERVQLAGLEAGATDYITKPFNFGLLRSKLHSILNQKDSMERTFTKRINIQSNEKEVVSADEQFMRKALEVVERYMASPAFSVEILANEMNLSRVGLYKRVLALSGNTPSEFIRKFRIERAAQLLEQSGLTVAEVAYEVGFNNPKQFSKYFKAYYGVVPSAYRK